MQRAKEWSRGRAGASPSRRVAGWQWLRSSSWDNLHINLIPIVTGTVSESMSHSLLPSEPGPLLAGSGSAFPDSPAHQGFLGGIRARGTFLEHPSSCDLPCVLPVSHFPPHHPKVCRKESEEPQPQLPETVACWRCSQRGSLRGKSKGPRKHVWCQHFATLEGAYSETPPGPPQTPHFKSPGDSIAHWRAK